MTRKYVPFVLLALGVMLSSVVPAHAAVDTVLAGAVTDTKSFWESVYDLKLAILIAVIGLAFLAKIRGK